MEGAGFTLINVFLTAVNVGAVLLGARLILDQSSSKTIVVAVAPSDGAAVLKEEGRGVVIYPPYVPPRPIVFHDDGFQLVRPPIFLGCNLRFQSIDQAAGYLQDQQQRQPDIVPPSQASLRLLHYASQEHLLEVLKRIRYELLPQGYCATAERLALEILKLHHTSQDIRNLVIEIMEQCRDKRQGRAGYLERTA